MLWQEYAINDALFCVTTPQKELTSACSACASEVCMSVVLARGRPGKRVKAQCHPQQVPGQPELLRFCLNKISK